MIGHYMMMKTAFPFGCKVTDWTYGCLLHYPQLYNQLPFNNNIINLTNVISLQYQNERYQLFCCDVLVGAFSVIVKSSFV